MYDEEEKQKGGRGCGAGGRSRVRIASGPDLFFFRGRRSGGLRLVRLYGSFTQCGASQPVAKVKCLLFSSYGGTWELGEPSLS
ncbi:hypothetical protein OsI_37280 [Oryza sativa Indica Group]|uniref:Uncharacterized protein n=1 Tax=Oryza sativa subsp. indica TaxID=39946 RepID=B8BP03_ORYSI|nr:hypothetical protein OsI_37280 [Oryza sativa Indica Group]